MPSCRTLAESPEGVKGNDNSKGADVRLYQYLYKTRRGYYGITVAIVVLNFLLGLDFLLPGATIRHASSVWYFARKAMPVHGYGIVAFVVVATMLCGLRQKASEPRMFRIGQALSVGLFTIIGVSEVLAQHYAPRTSPPTSFYGAMLSFFVVSVSLSCLFEPLLNPFVVQPHQPQAEVAPHSQDEVD